MALRLQAGAERLARALGGAALGCCPAAGRAQAPAGPVDPGPSPASGVVVRFKSTADAGERAAARAGAEVTREQALPVAGMEVVDPDLAGKVSDATKAYGFAAAHGARIV